MDYNETCVMCGGQEHRDADGMVERCPEVRVTTIEPVFLRQLGNYGFLNEDAH